MSAAEADALLLGTHADTLNMGFGAPDGFLSDAFGDYWELIDGRALVVRYDDHATVERYEILDAAAK